VNALEVLDGCFVASTNLGDKVVLFSQIALF